MFHLIVFCLLPEFLFLSFLSCLTILVHWFVKLNCKYFVLLITFMLICSQLLFHQLLVVLLN